MAIDNISEHANFILGLSGSVILGLLSIVWFFIKRDMGKMDKQIQDLTSLITKLDSKLDEIVLTVNTLKTEHNLYHNGGHNG